MTDDRRTAADKFSEYCRDAATAAAKMLKNERVLMYTWQDAALAAKECAHSFRMMARAVQDYRDQSFREL